MKLTSLYGKVQKRKTNYHWISFTYMLFPKIKIKLPIFVEIALDFFILFLSSTPFVAKIIERIIPYDYVVFIQPTIYMYVVSIFSSGCRNTFQLPTKSTNAYFVCAKVLNSHISSEFHWLCSQILIPNTKQWR